MFTSIKRVVRSGFVGFWRSAFVSLSAIFAITVTLIVVGSIILLGELLNASLTQIKAKVDVNVYMVTTAPEDKIFALKSELESLPEVKNVEYKSREKALEEFREKHKSDELTIQALEELNDNPLGASLSIQAEDPTEYQGIASFLEEKRLSEDPNAPLILRLNFNQNKTAIDALTTIIKAVEHFSYIAMLVLIAAAILISFNTIRLAIYTSREEIGVMRLVGASNMFIRGPFLLQGALYGFLAGIIALLVLYPVVTWLGPMTQSFFNLNIFNYFVTNFGYMFGVIVGSGVVLGLFSSFLAISRYLRV